MSNFFDSEIVKEEILQKLEIYKMRYMEKFQPQYV